VTDARSLFGEGRKLDVDAAHKVIADAGLDDALDNQIHIAALKRAVDRAEQS